MIYGNLGNIAQLKEWLCPALDAGGNTHSFTDIITGVIKGDMQLWHGPKGAAVTLITDFPQKRVLHVLLAGGDMQQIIDFQDSAFTWGKAHGCTQLSLSGRAGWQRALKDHGWHTSGVVMEYNNHV